MIRAAIFFFIVALIAAMFGFGGLASFSAGIGKTLLSIVALFFVIGLCAMLFMGSGLFARS